MVKKVNYKIIFVMLAFLFVAPIVLAANQTILNSPGQRFFLEEDTSLAAVFTAKNAGGNRVCYSASATSTLDELDLTVSPRDFCINAGENTTVTVTFNATGDTDTGSGTVTLRLENDLNVDQNSVSVRVQQTPDIEFLAEDFEICKNKTTTETISIKNNTGQTQRVRIQTSTNAFAPVLETREITLNAGEQKELDAIFYSSSTKQLGRQTYWLYAYTDRSVSVQKAEYRVKTCEIAVRVDFQINASDACIFATQGESKTVNFSIQNKSDFFQLFWLSAQSELPFSVLTESPLDIESRESASALVRVSPRLDTPNGSYKLSLTADNGGFSKTRNVCLTIGPATEVSLNPDSFDIKRGESFTTALLIKNNSTVSKTVQLSTTNTVSNATVSFSPNGFSLSPNAQKTVLVTVQTTNRITRGTYFVDIKTRSENKDYFSTLFFTVRDTSVTPGPPGAVQEKIPDIASFPVRIEMTAGETKELDFVVLNTGSEKQTDIEVRMVNLPRSVSFSGTGSVDLDANQGKHVRGTLSVSQSAPSQTLAVSLVAINSNYKNTKTVSIVIRNPSDQTVSTAPGPFGGIVSGLVGLGSSSVGFWFLIILAPVVLLVLFSWSRQYLRFRKQKQEWRKLVRGPRLQNQ